ncbi:MAG: thermonuclease family protein [Coriobacteriia bacterium]|nr:thermonuclease family protein [Coriobacteriia bacterium]
MKRIIIVLLVAFFALIFIGCGSPPAPTPPQQSTPVAEFYDYTNDDLGFAAQFPARPLKSPSSANSDDRWEIVTFSSSAGRELPPWAQPQTSVTVNAWNTVTTLIDEHLEETLRDYSRSAIRLTSGAGEPDPNLHIEFGYRQGYPSATTFISTSQSEGVLWHYATITIRNNIIYIHSGTRETEAEAIAAEASFRLLAPNAEEVAQGASEMPPPAPEPEVTTNRERLIVERIIDGDTIVARDESGNSFRIRLIGIDAPEANESGGTSATNYLAGMIPSGSEVWAEICPVRPVDRFDRERAYLWTSPTSNSDNDFVQARMLQSGNARASIMTPCCGYHTNRLR